MKVTATGSLTRALSSSALLIALAATLTLATPPDAGAATRAKTTTRANIIERSQSWVKQRVPYSQWRYYRGYRQDCSGFVSMAWSLGRSYSTRTLPYVARRVSKKNARPGDAVLRPGHAVIFAKWKSKKAGTFYAYEQRTWGKVASKSVHSMSRYSKVLRRPGLRPESRKVAFGDLPMNRAAATWGTDATGSLPVAVELAVVVAPARAAVDLERTAPPARQRS